MAFRLPKLMLAGNRIIYLRQTLNHQGTNCSFVHFALLLSDFWCDLTTFTGPLCLPSKDVPIRAAKKQICGLEGGMNASYIYYWLTIFGGALVQYSLVYSLYTPFINIFLKYNKLMVTIRFVTTATHGLQNSNDPLYGIQAAQWIYTPKSSVQYGRSAFNLHRYG